MKLKLTVAVCLAVIGLTQNASQATPTVIIDDKLGLSPVSVQDIPVPSAFDYPLTDPKESGVLPRSWEDAPPQVPHRVDKFLPINAKLNKCLECHEEPEKIGKKVKGKPTPMSETHYNKTGDELAVSSKRYVCNLCHTPQARVDALVENAFKPAQ